MCRILPVLVASAIVAADITVPATPAGKAFSVWLAAFNTATARSSRR
jgi:hypothetical protein